MHSREKMVLHTVRRVYIAVAIGGTLLPVLYFLSVGLQLPSKDPNPGKDACPGIEDPFQKGFMHVPRLPKPRKLQVPKGNPDVVKKREDAYAISNEIINCGTDNTECIRFRTLLSTWPSNKPKAALYLLTQATRLGQLRSALRSVDKYFNDKYKYPIIIFHEEDLVKHIGEIRKYTSSDVYFQQVVFVLPDFLKTVPDKISCPNRQIGYRHMCRFHAKGVYQQPIIRGLEYYWRLDDDSLLLRNVSYDVFVFMRDRNLGYGYREKRLDALSCIVGLWKASRQFIKQTHLQTQFFYHWKESEIFYNNFEISGLNMWLSQSYADYIEYIDRLGGIFYHRWGDAPIKSIAVSLFLPMDRVHHFADIGYSHNRHSKKTKKVKRLTQ